MTDVEISNPENSFLASDVLNEVAQLAGRQGISATLHGTGSDHRKGEVLNAIVLGMTSSAAYDLLKAVVMRFADRKDYQGTVCVQVDGVLIELDELRADTDRRDS